MRFILRYWTRRSADTLTVQCDFNPGAICGAARHLRSVADEHQCMIYGETFIRLSGDRVAAHLPVGLPGTLEHPDACLGRVDHGHVVAAYEVGFGDALRVANALERYVERAGVITGHAEYHFDPSVGRTEGLIVVPTLEHPVDKAAYISTLDAVTG